MIETMMRRDEREIINNMYYPENQNLFRKYQFDIVKNSLHTNTLVCLPTGLGKTFIASAIMYNFHRWFEGKIFFFAPTKPLVTQQKQAFTNTFPDLRELCEVLTGKITNKKREGLYKSHKIFFMTPQTLESDLNKNILSTEKISLLIFDEAHKAQKDYAYTRITKLIFEKSPKNMIRIIGLSASPGSDTQAIQNLINNLKIKAVEIRTDNDSEIQQYIHNKKIRIIDVKSTADISKMEKLIEGIIIERLKVLQKYKIIEEHVNLKYIRKGKLLDYQKKFSDKKEEYERELGNMMIREIYDIFRIVFQMMNSKQVLTENGIVSFKENIKKFMDETNSIGNVNGNSKSKYNNILKIKNVSANKYATPSKINLRPQEMSGAKRNVLQSRDFQEIKRTLFELETLESNSSFKQPFIKESAKKYDFSKNENIHPKLLKLKDIINEKLKSIQQGSKIIIFTHLRESSVEIDNFLKQSGEFCNISFSIFTGQGKGFTQNDQIETLRKFREGRINVLIATSVAEEGLDIGEVDTIICYEINSTSPIKMIQRFGRTGRKRDGEVIVLISQGEEKSKYFRSINRIKNLQKELKSIAYSVERSKISFCQNDENILIIPKFVMDKVVQVSLEREAIENTIDYLSDSEKENEESMKEEDEDNEEEIELINLSNNDDIKMVEASYIDYEKFESKRHDRYLDINLNNQTPLNNSNSDNRNFNNISNFFSSTKKNSKFKFIVNDKCLDLTPIAKENKKYITNLNMSEKYQTPKVIHNFQIFNKKTSSGSKYKTNNKERKDDIDIDDKKVIEEEDEVVVIDEKIVSVYKDKRNYSPIELLDFELNELFDNIKEYEPKIEKVDLMKDILLSNDEENKHVNKEEDKTSKSNMKILPTIQLMAVKKEENNIGKLDNFHITESYFNINLNNYKDNYKRRYTMCPNPVEEFKTKRFPNNNN